MPASMAACSSSTCWGPSVRESLTQADGAELPGQHVISVKMVVDRRPLQRVIR